MPSFQPFAGLRFARDRVSADDVVCPPYDVISVEERIALEARSRYNAVRVELPQDEGDVDRYQQARFTFDAWRDEGILLRDPTAAFYGHRMLFTDPAGRARSSTGVIGALGLEPPGRGILPHERTMPKPKGDRLDLLRATNVNVSPIWGLSPAAGLTALIDPPAHPLEHCRDEEGVTHQLWPITDHEQVAAITAAVATEAVIVADGHHRFETALAYQAERRAANGGSSGEYDLVMALIVELAEEELTVGGIHRLITGLAADFDLVATLANGFELVATDAVDAGIGERMIAAGAMALVTPAGTWLARPMTATVAAAVQPELDSSVLDVVLATLPSHDLSYQHGWELAAAAVSKGEAQAAVLIRPATVGQIAAVGRGGDRMPPKTTFFWPKPRTGLVFREVIG